MKSDEKNLKLREKRKVQVVKKLADRMDTLFSAWGSRSTTVPSAAAPVMDEDIDMVPEQSKPSDKVIKRSENNSNVKLGKKRRRKIEKAKNSDSIVELRLAKAQAKLQRKKQAKVLWE